MDTKKLKISRKYAYAFLNLFVNTIDEKAFLNIRTAFNFLKHNPQILNFFFLQNVSLYDKNELIDILISKFDLPLSFNYLTSLLLVSKRIFLFPKILGQIMLIYEEKKDIIFFNISSAELLNDENLQQIKKFLERKTEKKIIESYKIDKDLIAGIKVQSYSSLWEFSVAQKLKNLKKLQIAG